VLLFAAAALLAAPFWVGPSFESLPLTAQEDSSTGGTLFVYGTCDAKPDSGCSPPLQVQNATTCTRNPVGLDVAMRSVRRIRGGAIATSHERGQVDVSTGGSTATIYTRSDARARRAAAALRRTSQTQPTRLPPPVYPRAVLAELKRVVVARREHQCARAIGIALGLGPGHVRNRLRLLRVLPAGALLGVSAPRRTWAEVERDRQVAFWAHDFSVPEAMDHFSLSRAEVRRAVRRVRGLAGDC
jgi:hypothetical protein